jgi:murein DD-endopeptidase MepM/ murein hydrolase activator NlpD
MVLMLSAITLCAPAQPTRALNVKVDPPVAFIERRGSEQRINCDLLIQNTGTAPMRIGKIQVSVYDQNGNLAFRRYLDENGVPSGISIIPNRVVPAGGSIDVFNPFYAFAEEMPLGRLHYEVFFEDPNTKEPNLLNFISEAEIDVYPTPYKGKTRLRLPLKGRVYVFDGHDFYAHHRRQDVFRTGHYRPNSVRYAYDLMKADASGNLYHGDRFKKESWLSYGEPVYAPAAGTVVDAANNVPENSYKDGVVIYPQIPDELDPIGLGNHVVIDHGDGEFSILVHMRPGSVTVKKGDHVKQGEQVGAIGFSGDTFLPHLHYMLMDGIDERTSQGLPSYFDDFVRILGKKGTEVKHGQIDSGDFVESSPAE